MVILTAKLSKGKLIGIVAAAAALLFLIIFLANRGTGTAIAPAAAENSAHRKAVRSFSPLWATPLTSSQTALRRF